MKKIITTILLALSATAFAQKQPQGVTYDASIIKVSDGDTVIISAPFLPAPLKPQLAVRRDLELNVSPRINEDSEQVNSLKS
jgi:hypothetical protein